MEQDIYIKLIYKSLKGEISTEEVLNLDSWLKESDEHQTIYDQIAKQWELSANYQPDIHIDVDNDYELLLDKIKSSENENAPSSRQMKRRTWLGIAASFLLLFAAGWLWFNSLVDREMLSIVNMDVPVKEVQLPDGSQVWLKKGSLLKYPKTFGKGQREVIMAGNAYFDVVKNPNKRFVVHTQKTNIEVLGTSFDVREDSNQKKTIVNVVSGVVKFSIKDSHESLILKANEKGSYDQRNEHLEKSKVDKNDLAWFTKRLIFNNNTLKETFDILQKQYNKEIIVLNSRLLNCPFTGRLNIDSMDNSLNYLRNIYKFDFEKRKNSYIIKNGTCR